MLFNDNGLDEDLYQAIGRFSVDDRLRARIKRAEDQSERFRQHFPVTSLCDMSQDKFRSLDGSPNDFCHWITDGTKDVAQACSRDRIRLLGFSSDSDRRQGDAKHSQPIPPRFQEDEFQEKVVCPIGNFVRIHTQHSDMESCQWGHSDSFEAVCRILGKSLALKLLVLYCPEQFINITRIEWLERVVRAFRLRTGYSEALTNRYVYDFYREIQPHRSEPMEPLAFVEFLDQYLGLGKWYDKEYVSYLIEERGFPKSVVSDCSRLLRELSRYAIGHRLSSRSLMRIDDIEKLEELRGKLQSSEKWNHAYAYAFETLIDFQKVHGAYWHVPANAKRPKEQNEPGGGIAQKRREEPAWIKELKNAASYDAVVSILRKLGESHPFYRHYTTLCSLLAIATASKDGPTLRLTRGDDPGMNDQLECEAYGNKTLWHRTFIVSFSSTQHENVAMWGLYSKPANEAVCLLFPRKMMTDWVHGLEEGNYKIWAELDQDAEKIDIPSDQVEILLGDVLYGGDVHKDGRREEKYQIGNRELRWSNFSKELEEDLFHHCGQMTGLLKSISWFYEQEVRIIVRLKESLVVPDKIKGEEDFRKIKHLYLPLPEGCLKNLDYVLGPCVPKVLQNVFSKKIVEVTQSAKEIGTSDYNGKLKFRVG